MPPPLLLLQEISLTFGTTPLLSGASLAVATGDRICLVGRNGSGKSTLLRVAAGLVPSDGGERFVQPGVRISYLPQEPSVFRQLTSEENLLAVLETLPLTPEQQRDRLEELLVQMGLDAVRTSKAYMLSGGERRRLEIARSLTLQPSFVLLDEPFSGIDPLTVKDLQEIIRDLAKSGIGVLITDHNVRETLTVTDRAYILRGGKIFRKGRPEELSNDAEVRRVYLGDHFRLN